jgi:hypothetical protein
MKLNAPVLFIIFNRPDTTKQVFEAIRQAKPSRLYVAADGARENRGDENVRCDEARKIATAVDWPCEVHTLFREKNLGCGPAVSSAITWFFEHEPEGIILEDDCLPDQSFFRFCEVMLERYRDDERIVNISGSNFQNGVLRGDGDYYYSQLTYIWGWASWRRVWRNYDYNMTQWSGLKKDLFKEIFNSPKISRILSYLFEETYKKNINTWDYQYFFSNILNNGLSVIPNTNLISNIGFNRVDATHTQKKHPFANLATSSLEHFRQPSTFLPLRKADIYTLNQDLSYLGFIKLRLSNFVKGILKLNGQK